MKKILALTMALVLLLGLAACETPGGETPTAEDIAAWAEALDVNVDPMSVTARETTDPFSLITEDGSYTEADGLYTVSSAGTYVLSGLLEGRILVEAGADDEVILELAGCTIRCGEDSPIKVLSAGKVEISAGKGTENVIDDTRSPRTEKDETQGEGAISAVCDLKLKGSGTLVVNGGYNNGVYTKKDLKIQKLSLKSTAYNNALKGKESVTVTSGFVIAVSTNGDGVKTEKTNADKNGATRGDITISGGSVAVFAAGDGFQAAHDFVLTVGGEAAAPEVAVITGSYSSCTASDASTTSYKGVKVQNELNVEGGSILIQSYDDGLHADSGTVFDDGTKGLGTINVSGGSVVMAVYAPANKTAGGRGGPRGWSGQQTVIGADGIHTDGTLNISGGTVYIDSAYEGMEANVINLSGGSAYIAANDDGVNATKGSAPAQINVTGGYLEVSVSPEGDTDGIDSNGSYTQTGGVVIAKGPNREMAAALDANGTVSVTGGTLIVLGWGKVSTGGGVRSCSLSLHAAGSHTLTIDGVSYTFTNGSDYGVTGCYSDAVVGS